MRRDEQHVQLRCERTEHGAHRRSATEIEAVAQLALGHRQQPALISNGDAPHCRPRRCAGFPGQLPDLLVFRVEGRGEHRVAPQDALPGALQPRAVETTVNTDRKLFAGTRVTGVQGLQEPETALTEGQRRPRCCRPGLRCPGLFRGNERLARQGRRQRVRKIRLQVLRQARDGRRVEQRRQRHARIEPALQAGDELYGRNRVTAQLEEIILDAKGFEPADFRPHGRQRALRGRPRRHRRPGESRPLRAGGRQCIAIELVARAEWQLRQEHPALRHEVLGHAGVEPAAQFGHRWRRCAGGFNGQLRQ